MPVYMILIFFSMKLSNCFNALKSRQNLKMKIGAFLFLTTFMKAPNFKICFPFQNLLGPARLADLESCALSELHVSWWHVLIGTILSDLYSGTFWTFFSQNVFSINLLVFFSDSWVVIEDKLLGQAFSFYRLIRLLLVFCMSHHE